MTETRVLTCFESSSVRCLTRQEESLLQAAVAMTIVKKRFQERLHKKPRHIGRVDALLALPPPPTQFLSTPLPDHMDHMVQVACRLKGRTLQGVACHLVQQLNAWILQRQQREKRPDVTTTTITTVVHPPGINQLSGIDLTPVHDWMAKSLLSSSSQASALGVFQAIILQSSKKQLLDCWWHVLATLIHQIDHGTLPQCPSSCSLDRLAVMLLQLLQTTLATTTSRQHDHDPQPISSPGIPPLLQELLFPLPTPTNLSALVWNFAHDHGSSAPRHRKQGAATTCFLSPGAKLLLRLGLCRILLFQPETPRVSPSNASSSWRTRNDTGLGGIIFPGGTNNHNY